MPNGGTMLIGGLTEVESRDSAAGIPFVEHIPLLGKIFRSTDQLAGRRTLLMLLTAETVKDIFED